MEYTHIEKIMEENFSTNIKDVIGLSRDEAIRLSNNCIGTEHFILGIIRLKNSSAINLLNSLGVNIETLRTEIEKFAISKSSNDTIKKAQIPLKKEAEKALKTTFLEARKFESSVIGTPHLLLCVLRNFDDPITKILNEFDITYETVKNEYNNY